MAYKYNPLTGQMDRVVRVSDGDVVAIEDVAGLDAALAGKQATLGSTDDVPGLDAALAGKEATLSSDQKVPVKFGTTDSPDTTGWAEGTVYFQVDE